MTRVILFKIWCFFYRLLSVIEKTNPNQPTSKKNKKTKTTKKPKKTPKQSNLKRQPQQNKTFKNP